MDSIQNLTPDLNLDQTGNPLPQSKNAISAEQEEDEDKIVTVSYSSYNVSNKETGNTPVNKFIKDFRDITKKRNLLTQLDEKFEKEYSALHYSFQNLSYNDLKGVFTIAQNYFLRLNPNLITVTLTYDQSIHFVSIFENERIYLEVFIDQSSLDCYTSIYRNKKKIDEVVGRDLKTTFAKLENYFESGTTEEPLKIWNGSYGDLPQLFAT